jgi:hypothetical protein
MGFYLLFAEYTAATFSEIGTIPMMHYRCSGCTPSSLQQSAFDHGQTAAPATKSIKEEVFSIMRINVYTLING